MAGRFGKRWHKSPRLWPSNDFYGNVDEHKWESFTLTMKDDVLLKRIIDYTGNEPGTGTHDLV